MKEPVHNWKKSLLWITGSIGIVLIMLLALYFLVPRLIDLESIRGKIKAGISQELTGTMNFQKIEVSLFPLPGIVINRVNFSIPGTAEGTVDSLRVYPRLFPLLAGRVKIARIQLDAPHFSLTLPKEKKTPFSLTDIEERLSAVLNTLASKAPATRIVIENGSITVSDADRVLFSFRDLDGQIALPPGEASITLTCSSDIAKSISLGIRLEPMDFKGIGTLKLAGMKPHLLIHYLFPESIGHLEGSEGNLLLSLKMLGFKDLQADVQGSFPELSFLNKNGKIPLKNIGIRGALALSADKNEITLYELNLENPRLTLTGALTFNETAHTVSAELSGSQVDIPSVRNAALSLAGEVPIVQDVFAYVRGGRVPFITVRSQGASLKDLGKTESIFIKGLLERGEIFVPAPQLDFKEVNGDCVISRGILEGKSIVGNLGNSQVREGKLRVGLKGRDAPLHIDAAVKADLAEVRNILRRVIKDEPLLKEMGRIRSLRCEARGRVILGESTASIKPRVDLSEVFLTAEYERLPFPVVIKGGQFSYDETRIGVKKLGGTLGVSSFEGLTGELRLGATPHIAITSAKVRIEQGEVYPWLKSLEDFKGSLKDVRSVHGALNINTLTLKGPLLTPKEWHFKLACTVEDFALEGAFLPAPAFVKKGTIAATEEKIALTDAHSEILDASGILSGAYENYLKGSRKTDLTFQGKMGPRSLKWSAKLADLPPQFSLGNPVAFERAHIALGQGTTLFQGKMRIQEGPEITADVFKHPKGLVIKKLSLTDASSDAVLSVDLQEKTVKIAFAGKLSSETVNKIIKEEELPKGSVTGKFHAEIQREKPFRFTAQGKLAGDNISLSLHQGVPLTIDHFSMDGNGSRLAVETASVLMNNNPFSLQGSLKSTPEGLEIDMDLSSDHIEWEKVTKTVGGVGKGENKKTNNAWDLPLRGTVRLQANSLTYDKYTWMPFHADISVRRNNVDIVMARSTLCGISSQGTLGVTPDALSLDFQFTAENQELEPSIACLVGADHDITGIFDLKGAVKGRGERETLLDSLQGTMEFVAKDGRIYRELSLLKIFDFLEINQILRGFPEMRRDGIAYHSLKAKGSLKDGLLEVTNGIMDGSSIKVAAEGTADLKNKKVNFTVLICPLRRADFLIKMTPIIGRILGGTSFSIPLDVTGDLEDPQVSYHPVAAVGSGLLGIIKRTLETPVELFLPFLPGEKK